MALKRIQQITLTAQITARCAKHPVIDRSLARARTASVASANKSDTVGHSARECGKRNVRAIENDADAQSIHDANDKDADNCAMSVDGQSDDGNHLSERGDGDRHKESDRSDPSNPSGHKNDHNDDTSDAGSEQASIATDMEDESDGRRKRR